MSTITTLARSLRITRRQPIQCLVAAPRQQTLHTSRACLARKDTMDKDSMKIEPNEISKSGSDNAASATEEAAFDPKQTSPEEAHDTAAKESEGQGVSGSDSGDSMNNPLNASPANHELSQPRGQQEGGPEGSASETSSQGGREKSSGGGSGPKMGAGKSG